MKHPEIRFSLMAVLATSMLWVGCQKQGVEDLPFEDQSAKTLGAVLDDPRAIAQVPLIISSNFKNSSIDNSAFLDIMAGRKPGTGGGGKGNNGGGSTSDATAPTVTITSPSNGSSHQAGNINVAVSASDNVGVATVSVSVNGNVIGTSYSAPYNFTWNASDAANGNYTITATAKDAAGNSSSYSIVVGINTTVVVLPPPPSGTPSSYKINMPAVGYQGSEGSCVTFAVVYYGLSAEHYKKSGGSSYSYAANIFSPEFVYNQTKASTSCGSGSSMINTLNFIYGKGSCTWASMPYTSDNCTLMPTTAQTNEAANYKIKGYSQVMSSDKAAIKTLLSTGHPLMFTFTADANFYNAGPGYIWNAYSSTFYGPHAITLCGYDDSKNAYLAINQWGTGWGDAGYIWIDYNFFAQITGSAYTLNY